MDDRRYYTLDGMRGVAAIVVMIGHGIDWFAPIPKPRSWLAVDLFFALSGFVLARVYLPRFAAGLGVRAFMIQRFIRLWPLFAIGIALGTISAIARAWSGQGWLTLSQIPAAFVANLLMLPAPVRATTDQIFPLNSPGWSLFFELVVNLAFVAVWRHLRWPNLMLIVAASACWLAVTIALVGFGGPQWRDFAGGFPRVAFSFFVGVAIARLPQGRPTVSPLAWLLPLLLLPLLMVRSRFDPVLDAVLVFAGFPILIGLAARIEPPAPGLFAMLGIVSYPLYAIHEPLLFLLWGVFNRLGLRMTDWAPWSGLALLAVLFPLCLLADRRYDAPLRKWLLRRVSRRPVQAELAEEAARPL